MPVVLVVLLSVLLFSKELRSKTHTAPQGNRGSASATCSHGTTLMIHRIAPTAVGNALSMHSLCALCLVMHASVSPYVKSHKRHEGKIDPHNLNSQSPDGLIQGANNSARAW